MKERVTCLSWIFTNCANRKEQKGLSFWATCLIPQHKVVVLLLISLELRIPQKQEPNEISIQSSNLTTFTHQKNTSIKKKDWASTDFISTHIEKIEMGQWAWIEVEDRVCGCSNGVQDEWHVLLTCFKTESEWQRYGVGEDTENVAVLMEMMNVHDLVSFVHLCMKHFKWPLVE